MLDVGEPHNIWVDPVILLQIVMVSPGTHFVKNHGSKSITNESRFKKTRSRVWVFIAVCVTGQFIWRQFSEIKYSPSIRLKYKKRLK